MQNVFYTYFAENKLGWSLVCSRSPDDSWPEVEKGFVIVSKLPVIRVKCNSNICSNKFPCYNSTANVEGEIKVHTTAL
jgi:hypothetical protein